MNFKKIISLFCALAMLLSAASLTAVAEEINLQAVESTKHMIINDQFGENDTSGWIQVQDSTKKNHCAFNTEAIGNGNYALTYESFQTGSQADTIDWQFEFIKREGFGDGLVFTEGVDTVIKTRIKQVGTGRSFLKMNLLEVSGDRNNTSEWNFDWGTLFRNNKGTCHVPNGWASNGYMAGTALTNITSVIGKWVTVEIKIHGTSKTASYKITDSYGNEDTFTGDNVKSIDYPDAAGWTEDRIKNFAFRLRESEKLYVDYFQVWQEGVNVISAEGDMNLSEVKVKFTGNTAKLLDLSDYVDLYENDGITPVETTKSYNALTNTVTLSSVYEAGKSYKARVNAEKMLSEIGYTYTSESVISVDAPACTAQNLSVEGKIVPGQILTAKYILMPQGAVEGASVITWIAVDGEGNETEIQSGTSNEYIVEEEYAQHKIKYKVLPKAIVDGVEKTGILTECETPAIPLSKPVASNLKFNRIGAMIGMSLSAVYDYFDADGDLENGSIIKWYKGSLALSEDYVEFAEGKVINVTDDLDGMYLKFSVTPKNSSDYVETGDTVFSDAIGPVADIAIASNLFVNPGLEDGVIEPWTTGEGNTIEYKGLELSDEAYSGNYSLRTYDRYHNVQDKFYQVVDGIKTDKTYLLSTMVKSADGAEYPNFEGYVWTGASNRPYRDQEKITVTDEWNRCTLTFSATAGGTFNLGFLSFEFYENPDTSKVYPLNIYLDDLYLGELMITDIDTLALDPVTIPKNGEEAVSPVNATSKIYNQFRNTSGLTNQKPCILDPEIPGIKIDGLKVIISPDAVAGTYNIPVACVPNEDIPGVETYIEYVPLTLLAHDDDVPKALDVTLSGSVEVGNTLTGSYRFYQVDGKEDASTIRWLYSDTEDGVYLPIDDVTSETFVVTSNYAGKFIKFEVTPKTTDGMVGEPVVSDYVTFPTSPVASDITIKGNFNVGGTVTADYVFYDANGDEADNALYQWYIISDDGTKVPVSGATSKDFVLTEDAVDKNIKVEVTPVSKVAPKVGTTACSEAYYGPTAPEVKNVNVYNKNGILTGEYTYYHAHNASEKGTKYEWTVGGNLVSTNLTCSINFEGTQLVTFTVTPAGDTNPSTGEPVTVSLYVTGLSGSGSSGGSGGGFSGGGGSAGGGAGGGISAGASSGGVPNINEMQTPQTEVKEPENTVKSDIDGHWGADYVKKMEERGVMKADEKGNFDPDKTVVRSEMITYLFDALKLEESKYSAEFSDVSELDGYAGKLQTMINNGTIASYHEFRPNDGISREEMCKILYVSLENAGKLVKAETNVLDAFDDKDLIADWAVDYVNTIYANKIMIGTSDTTFAPKENITRAQVATMLVRILEVMEKEAE